MEIDELLELKCIDVDFDGNGVFRSDNFIVFAPSVLKDELAIVKIKKINKNFAFAELMTILEESPFRIKPKCPQYIECGGCNIMHMSYEAQTKYKRHLLKDVLIRVGKIVCDINETIKDDNPWAYRNHIQMPCGIIIHKAIIGYYAKESHDIVDIDKCYTAPSISEAITVFLKNLFTANNISIYNEKSKQGCIRHIVIKVNKKGDVMVIIVTNSNILQKSDLIISGLFRQFPMIKSIIHNINPHDTNVVMGEISRTIYGSDYIVEELMDLEFQIGPESFFQVNVDQTIKLYSEVLRLLNLTGSEVIIDAYCGVGSISLILAKKCKFVYGLEIIKEAIDNANDNKVRNKIENVKFILGDVNDTIKQINTDTRIDAIILDPPRKGCEAETLKTISQLIIPTVIYVSCNIRTLSRDLRILEDLGYKVLEATPVDMFPQTSHVETVVLMSRL